MGYKAFILFYLLLIETFIELMIKAMDMEILDWQEIDSWKGAKLTLMGGILIYQAFFRWVPFIAVNRFKHENTQEYFEGTIKIANSPWFLFSSVFHVLVMLLFGIVCLKLNAASSPLYLLLFIASFEIMVYLIFGILKKMFTILMGKNSLILSRGYLTIIPLKDVKSIEKKYKDEIYFVMKDGNVHTISFRSLDKKDLTEFLIRLKNNADSHNIYFANDLAQH